MIAQDRRPGGMACDDLTVFTSSYSAGSTREGTSYIRRAVIPLTVPSAAPTEVPSRRVHRRPDPWRRNLAHVRQRVWRDGQRHFWRRVDG